VAGDDGDDVEMSENEDYDVEIEVGHISAPTRNYTSSEFAHERSSYQYALDRSTNNVFFHTHVQEDAFFGHLLFKEFHKHQTIDFGYLLEQLVMCDLVPKFETLGLRPFLEHRCGWNATIVRQFYATLEINFKDQTLEWMTGHHK
jgi:hypothetical protein